MILNLQIYQTLVYISQQNLNQQFNLQKMDSPSINKQQLSQRGLAIKKVTQSRKRNNLKQFQPVLAVDQDNSSLELLNNKKNQRFSVIGIILIVITSAVMVSFLFVMISINSKVQVLSTGSNKPQKLKDTQITNLNSKITALNGLIVSSSKQKQSQNTDLDNKIKLLKDIIVKSQKQQELQRKNLNQKLTIFKNFIEQSQKQQQSKKSKLQQQDGLKTQQTTKYSKQVQKIIAQKDKLVKQQIQRQKKSFNQNIQSLNVKVQQSQQTIQALRNNQKDLTAKIVELQQLKMAQIKGSTQSQQKDKGQNEQKLSKLLKQKEEQIKKLKQKQGTDNKQSEQIEKLTKLLKQKDTQIKNLKQLQGLNSLQIDTNEKLYKIQKEKNQQSQKLKSKISILNQKLAKLGIQKVNSNYRMSSGKFQNDPSINDKINKYISQIQKLKAPPKFKDINHKNSSPKFEYPTVGVPKPGNAYNSTPVKQENFPQFDKVVNEVFQPYNDTDCEYARYGNDDDGGIVLCKNFISKSEALINIGIHPWYGDKFGCQLTSAFKIPNYLYDCDNTKQPQCSTNDNRNIFSQICVNDQKQYINGFVFYTLKDIIKNRGLSKKHITLKMNNEGGEYAAFKYFPMEDLDFIDQILLEVHFQGVFPEYWGHLDIFRSLGEKFVPVNYHANNHACMTHRPIKSKAYEITLVNKKIINLKSNSRSFVLHSTNRKNYKNGNDCSLP